MKIRRTIFTSLMYQLLVAGVFAQQPAAPAPGTAPTAATTPAPAEAKKETSTAAVKTKVDKGPSSSKKSVEKKKGVKSKPVVKKAAVESKYKTRDLSEATEHVYRFNAKGEPILPKPKKTQIKKDVPEELINTKPAARASCTPEEPCTDKNFDADTL